MSSGRKAWALVGLLGAGCSPLAAAEPAWNRVVLVELFTSQGCSSCPAAEAFLGDLPGLRLGRDKVLPLAYHVDYWDGLGWQDPFASPELTARQRRYAGAVLGVAPAGEEGIRGLYTPQMVVDGAVHFSGGRRDVALAEIRRAARRVPDANLAARAVIEGERAVVTAQVSMTPTATSRRDGWRLMVALAAKATRTRVTRGENAGRTLDESAVVRALSDPMPLPAPMPAHAAVSLRVTVAKPPELAWSDVEITAFVESDAEGDARRDARPDATLRLAAACAVPLRVP
jgi:hypothetical protein